MGWFRNGVMGVVLGLATAAPVAAMPVDLELVLAVDTSRSVDEVEFELQRQGYAIALTDSRVIEAIQAGRHRAIAVTMVEWAGAEFQKTVVPWTLIADRRDAEMVAAQIVEAPRLVTGWTSISGAIDFAVAQFPDNGFEGLRQVIDISGDGVNNSGRPAADARDEAVQLGITINGLAILNDRPNPPGMPPHPPVDLFYLDNVVGGPGSFMMTTPDFNAFGVAVLNKLLKEIAGGLPHLPPRWLALAP